MQKFFFIAFLLVYSFCFSQNEILIDEFDNNINNWWIGNSDEINAKISEGKYLIRYPGKDGYTLWNEFRLNYETDFEIECKIRQTNTENIDFAHGLIWAVGDWNNKHSLVVTGNQYYCIAKTTEGKYEDIAPYKLMKELIKPAGEFNLLKVKREGNQLICFINGVEVYKEKYKIKTTGTKIGFIFYNNKTVEVEYLKVSGQMKKINLIENPIQGLQKENLGKNINSSATEIWPIVSADGKTLYFVRDEHPENKSPKQDIWFSNLNEQSFSKAANSGYPLNNTTHNFVISVSADNNQLFVGHVYNSDGSFKEAGMSKAVRNNKGSWNVPEKILIKDFYNEDEYNEFYMSVDANYLLYTVKRKDTKGQRDVYVCFKENENTYSKPINLGDKINTKGDESSPFLSADNKTLYFSSDGWPGYGNNDIFVSKRLDDSWTNWTEPKNLGPEVNTDNWDAYFTIPASGKEAYVVSTANSLGGSDIFRIKMPEAAKPEPVVLIKGKVLNKKTGEPLQSQIIYNNINTEKKMGDAISNPQNGEYSIVLPQGFTYSFKANKEGFYPITDNIDVKKLDSYQEIVRDLFLVPIEVGQTIRLNNIFFEFDKSDLKSESFEELNRLCSFLKSNTKTKISISGHTDNKGDDSYNLKLSQSRVESVSAYLQQQGIPKSQFTVKGEGETKPLYSNDNDENRAMNRRVEFTILEK